MLITLMWVGVIFSFSLQPAEVSDQTSMGFGQWLVETFLWGISEEVKVMLAERFDYLHFLLRKLGHFTEFFVLGVLSVSTLLQTEVQRKGIRGIMFCALIASMDETIQLFVNGRSGQITDVLLDSVGAMVGIGVLIAVRKIKDIRCKRD